MSKELKKLWGSGHLPLMGIEIDTYVLEDGTPLIGKTKILKALGRPKKGDTKTDRPEFLSANNLIPFITNDLNSKLQGIEFKNGNQVVSAYSSDILPLICNVYLEARQAGVLTKGQLPIAQQCEILVMAIAKVGMAALVYESVGFEKFKHPEALRMLIESYLSDEIRKWSKEFPDELFRQMDRIYGNEKTTSRNRPQYYAKFLRKYIYDPIERGIVLKELDERTPRDSKGRKKTRLHQSASEDIGVPAIRAQIWQIVGVLKTSSNKRNFENNYNMLIGQAYYQSDLFNQQQ